MLTVVKHVMVCRLLDMDFRSSQRLWPMIQCRIWWQLAQSWDTFGCILWSFCCSDKYIDPL